VCVSQLPAPPTPTISLEMEQRNLPPSHPVLPALRSGLLMVHSVKSENTRCVQGASQWSCTPRSGGYHVTEIASDLLRIIQIESGRSKN
jgi:hypothetical protein